MASTIGIKIANGEFYSILEENSNVKKRLILTTVHDNQSSMQIDLYKSYTRSMADAFYIGSVVVENIKAKSRGGPSVELVIASNADGEITADATDLDASPSAEHMHLGVSLKSIDEDSRIADIPDFELESHEPPPQGLYERASASKARQNRQKFPWVVLIIIGVLIILLGLGLWFFMFRGQNSAVSWETVVITPSPQEQPAEHWPASGAAATVPAATVPIPAPPVPAAPVAASQNNSRTQTPVIQAPTAPPAVNTRQAATRRNRIAPPVASYKVPATIPRQGVPYKLRWGDTLWDISEAFYRNPWLYHRLARFNNIRNPDLIISGTTIRIPPTN
jgi:LysM repeat protein